MKGAVDIYDANGGEDRILLCRSLVTTEVVRLVTDQNISQVIQEVNPRFDLEVKASLIMSRAPDLFFDFPMSTVLSPNDEPSYESEKKACLLDVLFYRTDQKQGVLDQIVTAVKSVSPRSSLLEDAKLVSDELFSNALYNAPFVSQKVKISRKGSISTDPSMAARFLVGADSERVVIVCEDRYGTLDLDSFFRRIRKCLEIGKGAMINEDGTGGSGIGSFMIFETCISLFCGVKRNQKTTFACVFPIKTAYRRRADPRKNLHLLNR